VAKSSARSPMARLRELLRRGPLRGILRRVASWKRVTRDGFVTHAFSSPRLLETPHGFRLMAPRYAAHSRMRDGTFEPREVERVVSAFGEIDLFVDVGANVGFYTCLAAVAGIPVLAFEPRARNLVCLRESVRLNGLAGVEIFPYAVGAESGRATLYGASGPSASLVPGWAGYSSAHREAVEVRTLDGEVAARIAGKRVLIKIDVEGFEYPALVGARALLLAWPRPLWLVEICLDAFHPRGNQDFERTFTLFFDAGYRVFSLDDAAGSGAEITREQVGAWQRAGKMPLETFSFWMRGS
jgi:FkbM family methyltransferase